MSGYDEAKALGLEGVVAHLERVGCRAPKGKMLRGAQHWRTPKGTSFRVSFGAGHVLKHEVQEINRLLRAEGLPILGEAAQLFTPKRKAQKRRLIHVLRERLQQKREARR